MKKLHLIAGIGTLLLMSAVAMAEVSNPANISGQSGAANQIKAEIKNNNVDTKGVANQFEDNALKAREDLKQNIIQNKERVREEIKNLVNTTSSALRQNRESFGDAIKGKKEDLYNKIEQLRASEKANIEAVKVEMRNKIETLREDAKIKMETYRIQLKERLREIKDSKKVAIVEKIDARFEEINNNQVDHFVSVLEQLEKVLVNIKSRTDKAQANNKEVAMVRTAITAAETTIANTRAVVTTQSGKIYKITVTTEDKLKGDVQIVRQNLYNDLKAVRDKVKEARDAVQKAAVALAQIPRVDDLEVTETSTTDIIN